jgi:hypothetical protein
MSARAKTSRPSSFYTSWDREIEAIKAYHGLLNATVIPHALYPACIYEYAREQWWRNEGNPYRESFFLRNPWRGISEVPGFPKLPYAALKPDLQAAVASLFEPIEESGMFQFDVLRHQIMGTFDSLTRLGEESFQAYAKGQKPSFLLPRIPAPVGIAGSTEHVVFTLDYRKGKPRLIKDFEAWLDTHAKAQLKTYTETQRGEGIGLFRDRFKDLLYWRVSQTVQPKDAVKTVFSREKRLAATFGKTKARVPKFLDFLSSTSFSSFYALAADWKRWKPVRT